MTALAALLLVGAGTAAGAGGSSPAVAAADPSALWAIVSQCIDGAVEPACICPAFARSCCGAAATPTADVVWAETERFVAIRDMVMCGCPAGFVAGLALPRTRVTGIEDPRRPDGIWPFAWQTARKHIPEETEIALVINPKDARTQDQMHVHLLRLGPGVRAWLDGAPAGATAQGELLSLEGLDRVFTAAAERVGEDALGTTGILVAKRAAGGWWALLTHRTSPQSLTVNACAPVAGRGAARP